MKQKLRFILMTLLCAVFSSAWGETATLTNANIVAAGTENSGYKAWTITDGNNKAWNAYAIKNQHSNATSSYHFLQIKKYASNTAYYLQIPEYGTKITSITMTVSGTSKPMTGGENTATLFFSASNSTSATGNGVASGTGASSVTIDCSSLNLNTGYITASGAVRIWDVEVTYETNQVLAPTFSPKAGYYVDQQSVTISCATDGASIYYTTNGNDPTTSSTNYTAPINVSATTTIKAIAVKGNEKSPVASATYTFLNVACESLTELSAMTETDRYLVDPLDAWVTYVNGKYAYIEDISGGAIVLEKEGHGLTAGKTIKGPVAVDFQLNNGNPQITDIDLTDSDCKVEDGNAPNPLPVVVSGWDYDFSSILNKYLKITDATITKEGTNYYVQLGEDKVQLYGRGDASSISIPDLTDNNTYTIVSFPTMDNTTKGLVIFVQPLSNTASLPFEFDGGRADINITAGLTQQGLGEDYSALPLLKFDSNGDELVLRINERPGKLSFDIKGNGFSGGTFSLQVSSDGKTYTNVKSYTSLNTTTQSETVNNLDANVRYIKWIYTTKASGNVALGNIKLEKFTGLDPELSFEAAEYTAILGNGFTAPSLNYPNGVTVSYSSSNGEVATVDAATGAVTLVKAGETTITATSEANETYKSGSAFYKLTVIQPLTNIAALSSQTKGSDYIVNFNNVVVTYVNDNYAYLQDASGAIVMYKKEHGLTAGQVFNGTAKVTFQLYNGNPQITSLSGVTSTDGTAPEPTTVAASAWSTPIATVLSQYFKVTGATIKKDNEGNYYVKLGEEDVQLYGRGVANPVSVDEEYLSKAHTIIGFPMMHNTTKELVIYKQPEPEGIPSINTESSIELAYNATSGEIAYTINNPVDGKSLQATTESNWISNITVTGEKVTFTTTVNDGKVDRKATISLTYEGAKDVKVEVTQKSPNFATLPFAFNGGKAAIEETTGLTQKGLGSDYNTSTSKLKFDNTDDYLILKINERPGKLTFDIKGNGFSGGSFKVQTSENGETYTDLQTYTKIDEQSEEFENLGENVRYIKWIYTNKSSGNVGLGNITLTKNPELSFEKTEYTAILGEVFTTPTLNNPHELTVSYSSSNEEVATVDAATGAVTHLAAGEATITATSKADDNYSSGSASYKLTVTAGIPGDANNDGIVSVADVMLAVNYVLGNNPANFSFKNANVNNDDRITVADVMAIVKIVLGN